MDQGSSVAPSDERYAVVLDQALRALNQQQSALDGLRARAGTLVAAASLVSSFLGAATFTSQDLTRPLLTLVALGLLAFAGVVAAVFIIMWPREWRWGIDTHLLLSSYVEATPSADLNELRRSLAYFIGEDVVTNQARLDRLWRVLRAALVGIGAQVVLWTVALGLR